MARTIMTHMRHGVRGTLAACATVLLVAAPWVAASSAAAAAVPAAAGHSLKKVHDPGRVTGTIHGHCSYRDRGQLPDPRCTPGSIDPHVTQADIRSTICKKGWTSHGPAPRIPDRAVQVPRGLPGLPHAPLTANRAGPPRPAGTRRQ